MSEETGLPDIEANTKDAKERFLVVGIGASAGGIAALRKFFENVPADSGIAYVVILHLSPDYESSLAEILKNVAAIPIVQVSEKIKLKPDHGYVISPNNHLVMEDGHLLVSPNLLVEDRRAPVDIFFRTLAVSHSSLAACVVLSGTGANGSMGMKRIKELGGTVFVQDPDEAEFSEMPRNSINTHLVDAVLPVAAIPAAIIRYNKKLRHPSMVAESVMIPDEQQQALKEIFAILRSRTGNEFINYKRPTLLRRIERRINVHNLAGLQEYARYVAENPPETSALLKDLLISVTNFFRDSISFQAVERDFLPAILQGKSSRDQIRIWSAGCATGEEAYSLAMLCIELTDKIVDVPKIQIFGTDIDDDAINQAREGIYTLNDAADVSPERLRRFFNKEENGFRIRREVREMVLFATHNFLKDPPFSHLDMISCRNVLIYLNRSAQDRVMETFHFALQPGGVLFLGNAESVDIGSSMYTVANREHHIFKSKPAGQRVYPVPESVPQLQLRMPESHATRPQKSSRLLESLGNNELHQQLLEQYAPPSLIVSEDYTLLHTSDKAAKYLHFPGGEPSHNILQTIHEDLKVALRISLYQAVKQRQPVISEGLKLTLAGKEQFINLHIKPLLQDGSLPKGIILILFEDVQAVPGQEQAVVHSEEFVSQHLEDELSRTKTLLINTTQEHEFRGEELKASNEELQAMNEEMRSAAEELETSKEELQSMNEELRTVNQELKVKVEETALNNNNLQNLINSVSIATVFLDRSFRIAMFTPASRNIFNLIPADFGRSVSDITHKLQYTAFLQDAETVLDRLVPVEREVMTSDGHTFIMRILPYRTLESQINGVVLTFIDISARKQSEEILRHSEERFRLLSESGLIGIASFDGDGFIIEANPTFLDITGYSAKHIKDRSLSWSAITPPESNRKIANEIQALKNKSVIAPREWQYIQSNGTKGWSLIGAARFDGRDEGLAFMLDISDIKELEMQKDLFISIASHELKTPATAVKAYAQLLMDALKDSVNDDVLALATNLNRQVTRMINLFNTILNTNRIAEGQLVLNKRILDITGLITDEIELFRQITNTHILRVQLEPIKAIVGDAERISQVLNNLIINAIKYSPQSSEIIISAEEQDDGALIKIQDFGIGMDEKTRHRVFDRYYRSDNKGTEGLGLGLYVAAEIVKKHNGRIGVDSLPGTGSTFYFWLPAHD